MTMAGLRKVRKGELQMVHNWLKSHLPESWQLFGMTRCALRGDWPGQTFYTLGWPIIRGVINGELEPDHRAPTFFESVKRKLLYVLDPNDADIFFTCPSLVDWTNDFIVVCVSDSVKSTIQRVAREKGCNECLVSPLAMLQAEPGDIEPRPIPEGLKLRRLNIESDLEYCLSASDETRQGAVEYWTTLFQYFPNACLAESTSDTCVSFELSTECCNLRWLHTREDFRGKGLAKVIVSHLAEEYFQDNLPCVTSVYDDNKMSLDLHTSLGFKKVCKLNVLFYTASKETVL